MVLSKEQIMVEAMKLDPAERESLAEELFLSVNGLEAREIDAEWLAEARRRDEALRRGSTSARSVEHILNRLNSRD